MCGCVYTIQKALWYKDQSAELGWRKLCVPVKFPFDKGHYGALPFLDANLLPVSSAVRAVLNSLY